MLKTDQSAASTTETAAIVSAHRTQYDIGGHR
jgi:hypothetical protein